MHYVCIENDVVISILNYNPAVPSSVAVVEITDEQHQQVSAGTHKFDPVSRQIVPQDSAVLTALEVERANAEDLEFLRSTDWKVLRHMRQKALGITTSLTEEQYLELERQRDAAAARII